MDTINLSLGVFAVGFGLLTLIFRVVNPALFGKLAAMKEQWGDSAGTAIHVIAYSLVPILVGTALIVAGAMGVSFFGN